MTTASIRVYTAIVALICTAAITFALAAHDRADRWRSQVAYWEDAAGRSAHHDRTTAKKMRKLAARYNRLVTGTRRSQARLLRALKAAQQEMASGSSIGGTQATVYQSSYVSSGSTSGSGTVGAPAPTPNPTPPPPTSQPS
jgi:hypothetical protein